MQSNCILTICVYFSCIFFHNNSRLKSILSEGLKGIPEQPLPTRLETISVSYWLQKIIKIYWDSRHENITVYIEGCITEDEHMPYKKSPCISVTWWHILYQWQFLVITLQKQNIIGQLLSTFGESSWFCIRFMGVS